MINRSIAYCENYFHQVRGKYWIDLVFKRHLNKIIYNLSDIFVNCLVFREVITKHCSVAA